MVLARGINDEIMTIARELEIFKANMAQTGPHQSSKIDQGFASLFFAFPEGKADELGLGMLSMNN